MLLKSLSLRKVETNSLAGQKVLGPLGGHARLMLWVEYSGHLSLPSTGALEQSRKGCFPSLSSRSSTPGQCEEGNALLALILPFSVFAVPVPLLSCVVCFDFYLRNQGGLCLFVFLSYQGTLCLASSGGILWGDWGIRRASCPAH